MSFRAFALVAFMAIGLAAQAPAQAQNVNGPAAAQHVQSFTTQGVAILGHQSASLEQKRLWLSQWLVQGLDLPLIARTVAGKSWRQMSADQQDRYNALFSRYLSASVITRLEKQSGLNMTVVGHQPKGKKDIIVATRVLRQNGETIEAQWRVRDRGHGPKVIDIVIEGVSLVLTKRQEFTAIVSSQGIDGLLTGLEGQIQTAAID